MKSQNAKKLPTTSTSKKKLLFIAFSLLLFLFPALGAHAQNYVHNITQPNDYATIQDAVNAANDNDIIVLDSHTYSENVTIGKPLTIRGDTSATVHRNDIILDGGSPSSIGSAIIIKSNVHNVHLANFTIKSYTGTSGTATAGIYGVGSNDGLDVQNVDVHNNTNMSGFYANGPVDGITINKSNFSDNNGTAVVRGIVIWNGLKKNITITNTVVKNNNCCGIELQDGSATGVLIDHDTIYGVDNALGLTGLTSGSGYNKANIISNNIIQVKQRFGIEVKNPNGTGDDDENEDGAIIVKNNTITHPTTVTDDRDLAGIAVYRRGVTVVGVDNVNIPTGVVVKGNAVSGFQQTSNSTGFGIVVEGTNHTVEDNDVSTNNDTGILLQAGYDPSSLPGDADQSNLVDNYFGRGNAPFTCGITLKRDTGTIALEGVDTTKGGVVTDVTKGTTFCSIQTAVDNADAHDMLSVAKGNYDEQVVIDSALTIKAKAGDLAIVDFTGTSTGVLALFDIKANDVTIDGLIFKVDLSKLNSAIIASSTSLDTVTIKNNTISPYKSSTTTFGSYGDRNAVSVNYGGHTNYRNSTGGVDIIFENNTVDTANGTAFRSGISSDESAGLYTGNTLASINHDILVRFAENGPVTIEHNSFNGGGVEFNDPNAAGTLTIKDNIFDGTNAAPNTAMLRLKQNTNQIPTIVDGNTFEHITWGISLENYNADSIHANTFTPDISATNFRLITINTKMISTNPVDENRRVTIDATIKSNVFNGLPSVTTNNGKAISFYNHWADTASYGDFKIGNNVFNEGIKYFFYIDSINGKNTHVSPMVDSFPEYGDNITNTLTGYWTKDITDYTNWFYVDGTPLMRYRYMTDVQKDSLNSRVHDQLDDPNIGLVFFSEPLPIELSSFAAVANNCSVDLNWHTSSEKDNAYFGVERSTDGKHFVSIGRVQANGQKNGNSGVIDYTFTDMHPESGANFYRLRQVDFNQHTTLSWVVESVINCEGKSIAISPNPTSGLINISGLNDGSTIEVYNVIGQLVLRTTPTGASASIDLSKLSSGIYTIRISSNDGNVVVTSKVIKN